MTFKQAVEEWKAKALEAAAQDRHVARAFEKLVTESVLLIDRLALAEGPIDVRECCEDFVLAGYRGIGLTPPSDLYEDTPPASAPEVDA